MNQDRLRDLSDSQRLQIATWQVRRADQAAFSSLWKEKVVHSCERFAVIVRSHTYWQGGSVSFGGGNFLVVNILTLDLRSVV